jgi:nuclear pore complex protein Nup107
LQKVQFEAELWGLTRDLLMCNCPKSQADAQAEQETRLQSLHRYSTDSEIWEAFLDSDVTGQEYEVTLSWLQDRSAASSVTVEEAIAELTINSQRGEGVWSAGPIYTKNAIKAQKRSRSWPKPLEPSNPGIKVSHTRAPDGMPLVTQLDPDARMRENAVLQPQDDFHEQAAWQACWEFLRRGSNQDDLRDFWGERKEEWRAMILRLTDPYATKKPLSPWFRIINLVSNSEWLDGCRALSRDNEGTYTYQSAVYGLMCGDAHSSSKVCRTIDDNLFSMFNALLISRYKSYIDAYREKLQSPSSVAYHPPQSTLEHVRQYLVLSQTDEKMREESRKPHMLLEAAIICKEFDSFFVQQGQAAAQVAHGTGESAHLMNKDDMTPVNHIAQLAAQDPDSIRMIAHLQLLLKALGYLQRSYDTELYAVENNIANYIGWLQREGELELLPLYASKLSPGRIPSVMGAILIDITEPRERSLQIRLMKRYGINVSDVLWGVWSLANYNEVDRAKRGLLRFNAPKITCYVGPGRVQNIKIRGRFMSEEISEQEEIAIRSAEWFRYIDADNWGRACYAVSALYKMFLFDGKLGAARELARRTPLAEISLAALGINVFFAEFTEVSENGDADMDGLPLEDRVKPISPMRKKKERKEPLLEREGTSREMLASKALVWGQLEQLIHAMDALERWNVFADEVERSASYRSSISTRTQVTNKMHSSRNNTTAMRAIKKELRSTLDDVRESMYPLLEKDFLCRPVDEREGVVLTQIRIHFLPECILAYCSVLYFAGHYISRSWLVECMSLAEVVATTETLTRTFVEGKRMREFVDAMAWTAQGMVGAREVGRRGKNGKGDKDKEGELGLWSVNWPTGAFGVGDLESLD